MNIVKKSIKESLNKAFLKVKPNRNEIDVFKTNLSTLLEKINYDENEEHNKNLVSDFLKETYYKKQNRYINTNDTKDLVIYNGDHQSRVGVIIEVKNPDEKAFMINGTNINKKAFHQLVLYYLRERVTLKNLEIKHLIATNINEWFIFDATLFERLFAQNKGIIYQFNEFEAKRLTGTTTDFFYNHIIESFIREIDDEIKFTYFNIQDFKNKDDHALIALYKILSPEHLLKLPFINDSNSLDKGFYSELLHIIGLKESKNKSKKIIERTKEGERIAGTIIENCIMQLDSLVETNLIFNRALELTITWINRILFLKLLEAQLITYHKGDKSYSFLNLEKIKDYHDLNELFFQVLAKKHNERNQDVKNIFEKVPYLNSSLFDQTDIEKNNRLFISNLDSKKNIPIISTTILKDNQGKKRTGNLNTLEYLFDFLNAYDFSNEGAEEIQEDNKTLINASVLGLIFEKINGYKDGSFFTAGFITMYMCRETIRKAVIQKFNETKKWDCTDFNELYNKIGDNIKEANDLINSIKICDPAVGSGHFLVSALNEIISVKNDLKILQDRNGKLLKEYHVEVVNDALIITDKEGELFKYNPKNKESKRVQETIFHEKQTIIENCLFGVDINPNSVKICCFRLWIELLKNAYYKNDTELETLPNIDINIKCGNSLISRFELDSALKQALKKSKYTIDSYKIAIDTYRNAENKEQKKSMEQLISVIKSDFRSEISLNDPKRRKLIKLSGELFQMTKQQKLFKMNQKEKDEWNKKVKGLSEEIKIIETEIEEIKANKIFENAFEWRFEFPEVLNDDAEFTGFDVIVGNPPYMGIEDITWNYRRFYETIFKTATGRFDLYALFIEQAMHIKRPTGIFTYLVPGKFLNNKQFVTARKIVCENHGVSVVKIDDKVFEDAQVDSVIIENYPSGQPKYRAFKITVEEELQALSETNMSNILNDNDRIFRLAVNPKFDNLISKIKVNTLKVKELAEVRDGVVAGVIKDILYIDKKKDKHCHELYFGKHLFKYDLTETNVWINYKPDEMMQEEVKRKNGKRTGLWMRNASIFKREKILHRKIGKELIATMDAQGVFYDHTLHSTHITDKRFKTKYILALFNARLFKFYYHNTNSQGGDIFPQVRISSVENLPVKLAGIQTQEKIENLVDQILNKKSHDHTTDTTDLENKIDTLVYKIYDLTEDEIKIIEEHTKQL
ncbi:MAG: TaqI-like C-terminal specificity domain-containing protein [Phycisphaerales bacterium]|nr:TaqI-like C-terminal specificity domain-containing protein [Phycisphaerales bacterium]